MQQLDKPLAFKQYGNSGMDIIILHGLFGTLDNWQTIARKLGEKYRVTAFDLRNHGRSPHTEDFSIAHMASDVRHMMKDLSIGSAVMIGHSMGAKVVMHFALAYSALTDGIIILDMSPKAYERGHDEIFDALFNVDLSLESRQDIEARLKESIGEDSTIQFLMKNLTRNEESPGFHWKMNLPVLFENYQDITKAIEADHPYTGPALFIGGDRSRYIEKSDLELIHHLFPDAEYRVMHDAGHWIHADQPEETLRAIVEFMDEVN